MTQARILAFAGSARTDSFNQRLVTVASEFATAAGADVTLLNMRDFPLPLFDQDLEQAEGPPENATKLKQLFMDHAGLLIASPEYNSSISPMLKNVIDWVSRPADGEAMLAAYRGKVAALLAASPGALGGLRGLVHVRAILGNIGVHVVPDQVAVPSAHEAFGDDGKLKDAKLASRVERAVQSLVDTTAKLSK